MRYSFVVVLMGSFAAAPAASAATLPPGSQVVVAEDLGNDLLMHPSVETSGAARLGSTEINNPPHESFGMAQFPSGPDESNVRQPRTGNPTVSGQQAKDNAAVVHAERAAAAQNAVPLQMTAQEVAAQAAAAQAAGVQAARSQAMTSQAAATGAGEPSTTSLPVTPSENPAAPSDEAAPDKQEAQPDKTPGDAAPAEPAPAPGSDQE